MARSNHTEQDRLTTFEPSLRFMPSGVKSVPANPQTGHPAYQMKITLPNNTDRTLRVASLALACLGLIDSAYLWFYKITSNDRMCLGSGDCALVNYSEFSEIYGIPVALLGVLAYLLLAGILLVEPRWKPATDHAPLVVFGLSLIGILFSAYLTYIEFMVIEAVCPFCLVSAAAITLIFILAIIRLVKYHF
jgi:uncharacterized membrane protein